ncbi:MAG: tRNA pseudouridine(55) synthase TruB [Nevskiales bacterium]
MWPRIAAITAKIEQPSFAPRLQLRRVDGILLLDKPLGLSSNAALQQAKRLFRAQKAGHTGSLDPLATGLLPICFGEATKLSAFLLESDKRYRVAARLGLQTDTGDAEGKPIAQMAVPPLAAAQVEAMFRRHLGPQQQRPPMYSALKHQGQRLYALARQGIEVERAARPIVIHEMNLLGLSADTLEFEVRSSKGTYVRTLVEDLAQALGTCAHVSALRRLATGHFSEPMYSLEQLTERGASGNEALDRCLLPVSSAVQGWPQLVLDRDSAFYLGRGQAVRLAQAPASGSVALFNQEQRLLGIGRVLEDGRVAPQRLLNLPAELTEN